MIPKQQRLKPLMNYLGSKARSADRFIERMPPVAFEARVELFAGAHGIELALPRAKRAAILNDLDADVIGVPEAVASEPEAVMSYLQHLRSSRATFNRIRDLRERPEWHELPSAQRAAFMIYLSRESVTLTCKRSPCRPNAGAASSPIWICCHIPSGTKESFSRISIGRNSYIVSFSNRQWSACSCSLTLRSWSRIGAGTTDTISTA